jgi:hypothetical protein
LRQKTLAQWCCGADFQKEYASFAVLAVGFLFTTSFINL